MTAEGSRTPSVKHFFPFRGSCTLRPHSAAVNFLDFSRDGEFLLAASSDKTISLSAPQLGRHIASYGGSGHQAVVTCVSSGFGNASFLSTSADGRAFLWDVETQQVLRAFPRQKGQLKTCLLLDACDPPRAGAAAAERGGAGSSSCSDTRISQVAVLAGEDRAVRFFDIRQKNRHLSCLEQLRDAKDSITCLLFTGHSLLASSADGCVYEYDIRKGRLHVDEIGQPVSSISLSAEGDSLLLGCADGYIRLQERASGEVLLALAGHASKLQHYRLDTHFTLLDSRRRKRFPSLSCSSSAAAACAAAAQPHKQQQLAAPLLSNRGRRRVKRRRRVQHLQLQQQEQQQQQQDEAEEQQTEDTAVRAHLAEDEQCDSTAPFKYAQKGSSEARATANEEEQEQEQQQRETDVDQASEEAGDGAESSFFLSDDVDVSDDYFSSSEDEEEGPPVYRLCVLSGSEDGALVGWDLQTAAAAEEEEHQPQRGCMVIRKRVHAHTRRSAFSAATGAAAASLPSPFASASSSAAAALRVAPRSPPRPLPTVPHALHQQQREPVALLSLRLEEARRMVVTGASDGVIKVWKKR